jgi:hypothetical protein
MTSTEGNEMTTKTDMTVANTIVEQLGGRHFIVMCGVKRGGLVGYNDALVVSLPRGLKVKITLTPMDDYTVETFRVRNNEKKTIATTEGVYCDLLQDVFTSMTGLFTHL